MTAVAGQVLIDEGGEPGPDGGGQRRAPADWLAVVDDHRPRVEISIGGNVGDLSQAIGVVLAARPRSGLPRWLGEGRRDTPSGTLGEQWFRPRRLAHVATVGRGAEAGPPDTGHTGQRGRNTD